MASPMRLATAPGRLARPAPPGNDDPCVTRRTIPEGMPRLPREAFKRGFRRVVPVDAEFWRACPPKLRRRRGERRARARARNPTWSAERRAFPSPGNARRFNAGRASSSGSRRSNARRVRPWCAMNARRVRPAADRERRLHAGHGVPIWVRRRHPSATGAPHAPREGASEKGRGRRREWRV